VKSQESMRLREIDPTAPNIAIRSRGNDWSNKVFNTMCLVLGVIVMPLCVMILTTGYGTGSLKREGDQEQLHPAQALSRVTDTIDLHFHHVASRMFCLVQAAELRKLGSAFKMGAL
jgi:hypothetical protein